MSEIIVCTFSTTDIKGRRLRGAARDAAYAKLKRAVLDAGMFSVFEATQSMRAADLFTRLSHDPELELFVFGYPWTGVRKNPGYTGCTCKDGYDNNCIVHGGDEG